MKFICGIHKLNIELCKDLGLNRLKIGLYVFKGSGKAVVVDSTF